MKFEKSSFDLEKDDEQKNFDDEKLSANANANAKSNVNANAKSNANANNLFDDMNENENQTDSAKSFQKKENAMTKIARDEQKKSDSKNV